MTVQPTDPTPAPAPTPAPPAPAPAPVPGPPPQPAPAPTPAPPPNHQSQTNPQNTAGKFVENGEVYDFPEHTPLASMTANQQSEYWRHKARRHEDRVKGMSDYDTLKETAAKYSQLVAASQTEQERAVAEATRQGHATALKEFGGQLVEQWFRVHTAGRLPEESVNALLSGLDRTQFIDANGNVDAVKVQTFVNSIVPAARPATVPAPAGAGPGSGQPPAAPAPQPTAPPRGPDLGQGTPTNPPKSGLEAGRELARARFGTKTAAP